MQYIAQQVSTTFWKINTIFSCFFPIWSRIIDEKYASIFIWKNIHWKVNLVHSFGTKTYTNLPFPITGSPAKSEEARSWDSIYPWHKTCYRKLCHHHGCWLITPRKRKGMTYRCCAKWLIVVVLYINFLFPWYPLYLGSSCFADYQVLFLVFMFYEHSHAYI